MICNSRRTTAWSNGLRVMPSKLNPVSYPMPLARMSDVLRFDSMRRRADVVAQDKLRPVLTQRGDPPQPAGQRQRRARTAGAAARTGHRRRSRHLADDCGTRRGPRCKELAGMLGIGALAPGV